MNCLEFIPNNGVSLYFSYFSFLHSSLSPFLSSFLPSFLPFFSPSLPPSLRRFLPSLDVCLHGWLLDWLFVWLLSYIINFLPSIPSWLSSSSSLHFCWVLNLVLFTGIPFRQSLAVCSILARCKKRSHSGLRQDIKTWRCTTTRQVSVFEKTLQLKQNNRIDDRGV